MVFKLVKNGLKDSKNKFLPIMGMVVAMMLLLTVFIQSIDYESMMIGNSLILLVVMALAIATVVMSILGFIYLLYLSVYDKNGYQLFTLPVKTWEIVVSKIIIYIIWNAAIITVSVLSISVMLMITMGTSDYLAILKVLYKDIQGQIELRVILTFLLNAFVNSMMGISFFLLCGSVIHSTYIQNNRKFKMFLLYVIGTLLLTSIIGFFTPDSAGFILNFEISGDPFMAETVSDLLKITSNVKGLQSMNLLSLLYAVLTGFFLLGTVKMWDTKLEIID
ncbi:MAG: hypothetical protein GX038_00735 [Erysipelothrix sp.]|nr:hypothetical protein [Erysipelothrix sp.]